MESLSHSHSKDAIKARIGKNNERSYIRDFIYGSIDGTVTTFAVIAGAAGAGFSEVVIFVLGSASLIADGFSMAVGNYEGVKAEKELLDKYRRMEEYHIQKIPEGEKEELRQIYKAKGFSGEELEALVHSISSNKDAWVDVMLAEEHGLSTSVGNPIKAGAITFIAFCWIGLFPILPYIFKATKLVSLNSEELFVSSSVLTALTFYSIGAIKGKIVQVSSFRSGISTLLTGGAAAAIAYFVGMFLSSFV